MKKPVFDDFIVDVKLFRLFYHALTYEVNRSYEFWYDQPEEFPDSKWHDLYADLYAIGRGGLLPDKEFSILLEALDTYATSVDRRAYNVQ